MSTPDPAPKHAADPAPVPFDATNPLQAYPLLRQDIYVAYWLLGLTLGAVNIVLASTQAIPTWFLDGLAVYGYLGTALHFTAAKNI